MIKKIKIGIVEDEKDLVRLLSYNLISEGYDVISWTNGETAYKEIPQNNLDLLLLDRMLPGMDGAKICELLKTDSTTKHLPILMLTAKSQEEDIVEGLRLGADDYLTKPFSLKILLARIKVLLRRTEKKNPDTVLVFNSLKIYPENVLAEVDGEDIGLTTSEFKMLHYLAQKPGWVFSRNQIIDAIKGEDYIVTDRIIDVLAVAIRKKLGNKADLLQTVRGMGYKLKRLK
jgi:two-component system phosphate regulon response regulator PhoB